MIKKTLALVCAVAVVGGSIAQAAPIISVIEGSSFGGNDLYTFSVDPNGSVFDTIDITLSTADAFVGENNVPVTEFAAGNDNTDVLGINTVALGWSILMTDDSATTLAGAGGPLGLDIVAPVNFAQAVFPAGSGYSGTYVFNFADDGGLVGTASGAFGIPEPSTLAIAGLGLLASVMIRRRS